MMQKLKNIQSLKAEWLVKLWLFWNNQMSSPLLLVLHQYNFRGKIDLVLCLFVSIDKGVSGGLIHFEIVKNVGSFLIHLAYL